MALFRDRMLKINKKFVDKSALVAAIFVLVFQFGFPNSSYIAFAGIDSDHAINYPNSLPIAEEKELKLVRAMTIPVTAYNSLPGQTDNTPCITANGFDLCENDTENVIAANFLPFGTMVKIPAHDPDTIFTVQDRMNARYNYKADIWMKNHSDAIKFGQRNMEIEIYEYAN